MTKSEYYQELALKTDNPALKKKLLAKGEVKTLKSPVLRTWEKIDELKKITETIYNITDFPIILFDLKGRAAGQYVRKQGVESIRYNAKILNENTDDFIETTVPHEWAHFIVRNEYGRDVKAHGKEWRNVCVMLGMEKVETYHNYAVEPARRVATFSYACGCKIHTITKVRHNRMLRGAVYTCRDCGMKLERVDND